MRSLYNSSLGTPTQEEREKRKLWQQLESVGRVINQIVGMADMFGQFGPSPTAPVKGKYEGFDTKPAEAAETPGKEQEERLVNWKEGKFDAAAAIVRGVVRTALHFYPIPCQVSSANGESRTFA